MHGVLVVDKPSGLTSAAVVSKLRRALGGRRKAKVGHTGTLDPLATGVLPIVLGEATKLATHLLADEKSYEADLELGVETDTLDADGEIVARAPEAAARVTEAELRAAIAAATGTITQVPPMYSSIKHKGRALHELAREGVEIDRAPREVTIHRLVLLAYAPLPRVIDPRGPAAPAGPRARIAIDCSKGTYVRVLAADLGRVLGCGAHLVALRRTRSSGFTLADAIPLADVLADPALLAARVIPPPRALGLPSTPVPDACQRAVFEGRIPPEVAAKMPPGHEKDALGQLVTEAGHLLALTRGTRVVRVLTYGLTTDTRSRKVPASS